MDVIIELAEKYSALGRRELKNGTLLYGKAPHAGPEAYLHNVFSGCSDAELDELQTVVPVKMPLALRAFLATHNGFDLFSGTLSFFGLRKLSGRTYDAVMGQPYCIVIANTRERPDWLNEDEWVVGTYNWDGSRLCISASGRVTLHELESGKVCKAWASLDKFLSSESQRLPKLFNDSGQELDEDESTLPC